MVLVSGCDFSLEDELLDVSASVLPVLPVTVLFEQSQQPSRVEESSQPVRRHPLPSLQSKKCQGSWIVHTCFSSMMQKIH